MKKNLERHLIRPFSVENLNPVPSKLDRSYMNYKVP